MTEAKVIFENWLSKQNFEKFQLQQPVTFNSHAQLSYKFFCLSSLFQERSLQYKEGTYNASSLSNENVNKVIEPWEVDVPHTTAFREEIFEKNIDGTEEIYQCSKCVGYGKATCGRCNGKKEILCSNCRGNGKTVCNSCSGNGSKGCSSCSGKGISSGRGLCSSCSGSGKVRCKNCVDGYNVCGRCVRTGLMMCHHCDGDGTVTCDSCLGKGKIMKFKAVIAKNFINVEHFDVLDEGLTTDHIGFFKPMAMIEARHQVSEINKEVIKINDVPKEIFDLSPEKVTEIFKEDLANTEEIVNKPNCRKLEMLFGVIDVNEFYDISYAYDSKEYQIMFFQNENRFLAPRNPWDDFSHNIEKNIEILFLEGNRKMALEEIKSYQRENVNTAGMAGIKKKILEYYVKRDVRLFLLPYLITIFALGISFNVSQDNLVIVFLLTAIPFSWIIYNRHKSRVK